MSETNNDIRLIVREEVELYHKELNEKKEEEHKAQAELILKKTFKANFFAYTLASIVASLIFPFLLNDYSVKYYLYFVPAFVVSLILFLVLHKSKINPARKLDLSFIPILNSMLVLLLPIVFLN